MTKKAIKFTYWLNNGVKKTYPFRVGDIVDVINIGRKYSSYSRAYEYFTKSAETPYYCKHGGGHHQYFKIFAVVEHESSKCVIAYCKDREGRDIVIGMSGLGLVRQYPLRKGESNEVYLEKIQAD